MNRQPTLCVAFAAMLLLLFKPAGADSWPTHGRSPTRNAVTPEPLPAGAPRVLWEHVPAHYPTPAWHGPAKWDAYANLKGLHSMRGYDQAFHTVCVEDAVFYSSSAEDCVRRLNARTGEIEWTRVVDGPVRVAPSYDNGKVYFASDDGHAYCVSASTGEVVWNNSVRAGGRLVLNNGKLIPLWPIRTGVSVLDGVAYYAASLLPWRDSYLVAADAETGEEIYRKTVEQATFEAPLVVSPKHLLAPQGRVAPLLFERASGDRRGVLPGGGGSFAVLVDDDTMMHGPGNKGGWLTASKVESRESLATHEQARAVVAADGRTCFITEEALVAIDYEDKETLWKVEVAEPLALIGVGDALVVGGVDYLAAFNAANGRLQWRISLEDRVKGLSFSQGRLIASLDTGVLRCYGFGPGSARDIESASESNDGVRIGVPEPHHFRVAVGPWLQFTSETTAEVHWRSVSPVATNLTLLSAAGERSYSDPVAKTIHRVQIPCGRNQVSHYRIAEEAAGETKKTPWYECDTFFNYSVPSRQDPAEPADEVVTLVDGIRNRPGLAVVLGASADGGFERELAQSSQMRVLVFDPRTDRVARLRQHMLEAGLYGSRVVVRHASREQLGRVTDRIATLVTSPPGNDPMYPLGEAERLVTPSGVIRLPLAAEGEWAESRVRPRPGESDWDHIYGTPNNTAYAGESLGGVRRADDLAIQWIGRPGPRYQSDRSGRKTPPLASSGRLFLQGLNRMIAMDSYNGVILWSLETPYFERYNMPRDCANWCASESALFAVVRDHCWRINPATGEVLAVWPVEDSGAETDTESQRAWGYVGHSQGLVVGSTTEESAIWMNYWGGPGWYDGTEGEVVAKVASNRLFALDEVTGERRWSTDRLILNTTITLTNEAVYFAECRSDLLADKRRLDGESLWSDLWLTALDLQTGEELWSKQLDEVHPGTVALWLAESEGRLAVVSSADAKYDIQVLAAVTGEPLWRREADWGRGKADHGTHLSRPAMVEGRLIVRPAVFDLETGATDMESMPVSGCGTYACTQNAVFFRAWSGQQSAVWDPEIGDYSRWNRLRPDCWLSTIPAHGLLLAPEGGGGCSCGAWLESSLAFAPVSTMSRSAREAELRRAPKPSEPEGQTQP